MATLCSFGYSFIGLGLAIGKTTQKVSSLTECVCILSHVCASRPLYVLGRLRQKIFWPGFLVSQKVSRQMSSQQRRISLTQRGKEGGGGGRLRFLFSEDMACMSSRLKELFFTRSKVCTELVDYSLLSPHNNPKQIIYKNTRKSDACLQGHVDTAPSLAWRPTRALLQRHGTRLWLWVLWPSRTASASS